MFAIIIICLSLRTIIRNLNWANELTLYTHDAQINTNSYALESNLANALINSGQYSQASVAIKKSLALQPNNAPSWVNLGIIYIANKKMNQGLFYERKALNYDGGNYKAFYYLSLGSLVNNDPQSTKSYTEWGLKSWPNDPNLTLFKAVAEYRLNNKTDALKDASFANMKLQTQNSNYIYPQITNNQPITLN